MAKGRRIDAHFGFAGWSGSGKTTLIEQIIPRLLQKGLTVSLVKHAHHRTEFDQPGKDSYRLRHAGCSEVLVTSGARWALMHELRGEPELPIALALERLSPCDLVLIEGTRLIPFPSSKYGGPRLASHCCIPGIPVLAMHGQPDCVAARDLDRFPVFPVRC
jgi:molybdopterin-guanine dinucleotide biosynthesis protein MobB